SERHKFKYAMHTLMYSTHAYAHTCTNIYFVYTRHTHKHKHIHTHTHTHTQRHTSIRLQHNCKRVTIILQFMGNDMAIHYPSYTYTHFHTHTLLLLRAV